MPDHPHRFRRRRGALAGLVLAATAPSLLTACAGGDDRTRIVFFQFKPEAVTYFEEKVAEFEAANPDIDVVVTNVPDPETALRTRLVKDDVPDVLTLNANGTFGELASAGIFDDYAGDPVLEGVTPAYLDVLGDLGASSEGAVNGVPFAANASGILYNTELFAKYDVEVPRTWSELLEVVETFESNGVLPFYGMLGDSWTPQSPLAPISAQTQPDDFFESRFAGETSFSEGWRESAEKILDLYDHDQDDSAASGYEDGTAAFAQGESAMLLLGSYAVPQIRTVNPDAPVGIFALPATDDPAETTIVSGIDVVLTTGAEGDHPEESRRLVEFLMQPEVLEEYAAAQVAIPPLEGTRNDDPALAGVQHLIDEGRIVGFTDHQFIPAIPLAQLLQELVLSGDVDTFLARLDETWDQVAERRTWGLGAVTS